MPTNLPIDLLRSLVAIVDTGSMIRATERTFRTQSALSLQMRRLESLVQTALFRREGRRLALTTAGESLLVYAREMLAINDRAMAALNNDTVTGIARVGLIQDFAESNLVDVLARFAKLNPRAKVQVRVTNSHDLLAMLDSDRLDLVLCMSNATDPGTVTAADMIWLGDPSLIGEGALPLAVLDGPCQCRDAGVSALERAGVNYEIVLETSNLSVLMGAVKAGLALTSRPAMFAGAGMPHVQLDGVPLPKLGYVLRARSHPSPAIVSLSKLLRATLKEM